MLFQEAVYFIVGTAQELSYILYIQTKFQFLQLSPTDTRLCIKYTMQLDLAQGD